MSSMKHLVQFSTGVGSAEVAWRCVEQYGSNETVLLTADTRVEDGDNWRFAHEVVNLLGPVEWVILADGRTPMQAGRDVRVVPNNRMAVCSRILKRELLRRYMDTHFSPAGCIIELGFDWTEESRFAASVVPWEPWAIGALLMEPPYLTKYQMLDAWRGRGIEPPRLYAAGFSHANCGGACVRGGQAAWRRLLYWDRDRYLEWEAEEETTRTLLGKNVSILRDRSFPGTFGYASDDETPLFDSDETPLPLSVFRHRLEATPSLFDAGDEGACGCFEDEILEARAFAEAPTVEQDC